ncbi:hypothetical protein GF323_00095 [Candidatus Woesearchaeota archaeon]|nr:hypothetical protein [Candidatus Woesearchaeota archaeon]
MDGYDNQNNMMSRRDFLGSAVKATTVALGLSLAGCSSIGTDLNKYRKYSIGEGSRESLDNLEKALENLGLAGEGTLNFFTLGYGTNMIEPFRHNDFKDPFWQAENEKVLEQGGKALARIGATAYSLVDLVAFDSLPDFKDALYKDMHPVSRPLVNLGKSVDEIWKTANKVGNVATMGYFDNLSESTANVIYGVMETLKQGVQAAANSVRGPVYLITGENEGLAAIADWAILVPTEYVSNVLEMKGIENTQSREALENAFEKKGIIGTHLEIGGSGYIFYLGADEIYDECKDDDGSGSRIPGGAGGETPPPDPWSGKGAPGAGQ